MANDEQDLKRAFGARLSEARRRAGFETQDQARDALGLGKTDIVGQWERGANLPGAESLIRLCRTYRVSSDWLLGLSELPTLKGSGGVMDLSVEQAIIQATTLKEAQRAAAKLGAFDQLTGEIEFGYELPKEFQVLDQTEWNDQQVKPGDVVQLKSGGELMSVEYIEGSKVFCVWFDVNTKDVKRAALEAPAIVKYSGRAGHHG